MNLIIKKACTQDLDSVAALYAAVCAYLADKPFNPGWRQNIFPAREDAEQYLAAGGLYIARSGKETVGTIALTPEANGTLCIHEVAVRPDHQRQGISAALLDFTAKEAAQQGVKSLRLHVWEGNTPAIRTYEKNGFVRMGKEDIGLGEFGLDWFYLYEKRLEGVIPAQRQSNF